MSEDSVALSLEHVVQKASELEGLLRECKGRLEGGEWRRGKREEGEGGRWGEGEGGGWEAPLWAHRPPQPPPASQEQQRLEQVDSPALGGGAPPLPAWQTLVGYIVGLEGKLQYYQSLVEELQRAEVTTLAGEPAPDSLLVRGGVDSGGEPRSRDDSDALPEDRTSQALLLSFSWLSTAELCAAGRVCRQWRRLSRHPLVWRRVSISEKVLPPQLLYDLAPLCSHTESISLHGLMPDMASCEEDLQSYIDRIKGSLEGGVAALLASSSATLTSLSLTECSLVVTQRVFWLASVHCPLLRSFTYSSDEFPPTTEALWSLINGCPHMQQLSLPPVSSSPSDEYLTDSCVTVIAHHWQYLRSLTIGGKGISTLGLATIAQWCSQLQHLELINGPQLRASAVSEICEGGFHSLHSLTLISTPASPKAIQQFITLCPYLSCIHMHISIHTFFPQSSDISTISKYEKIRSNLKELERHSLPGRAFHLHEYYSTGATGEEL